MTQDNEAECTSKLKRSEHKPGTSSQPGEYVWSVKDSVTVAEINATLQFSAENVPFSCAENIASCYQEQFADSSLAKNVTIGPTKISYLVSYTLGPHFNQITMKERE